MATDWDAFAQDCTWYARRRHVVVGDSGPFAQQWAGPPELDATFPILSSLLGRARVTNLTVDSRPHVLFGWTTRRGESTGWLSPSPGRAAEVRLYPDHANLLSSFGGILERWNEPEDTWLLNLNEALTLDGSASAEFIDDYSELFTMDGVEIPIALSEWYVIAREANGNSTICNVESGSVLLFAPDHSFTHIKPLPGCPEYTLYTLEGAPDFRGWVEQVTDQWLRHVRAG